MEEKNLIEHLKDLRKVVLMCMLWITVGMIACWAYGEILFDIIRAPISPFLTNSGGGLVYTSPLENFFAYVKVALVGGIILSCPLWIYQIWWFVSPALYREEKKYALFFVFLGSVLFLFGVSFSYFVVYPIMFDFLFSFGGEKDVAMITMSEYLGFFIKTTLLFGLAFEMPLVILGLGLLGFVDSKFLRGSRRHAIFIIALVAAVLTPPDPFSMAMMWVPLYTLFELSILGLAYTEKRK